jgi:hypothetical protein
LHIQISANDEFHYKTKNSQIKMPNKYLKPVSLQHQNEFAGNAMATLYLCCFSQVPVVEVLH